jgi:hypothetical protein
VSTRVANILTNLCLCRLDQRSRFEADLAQAYTTTSKATKAVPIETKHLRDMPCVSFVFVKDIDSNRRRVSFQAVANAASTSGKI